MEKRKLMALASSAAMVMASMGIAPAVMADEVEKPEKITVMFDGTVFTQENGQAEFEARWEELTGIAGQNPSFQRAVGKDSLLVFDAVRYRFRFDSPVDHGKRNEDMPYLRLYP